MDQPSASGGAPFDGEVEAEAVRRQLERIISSPHFTHSPRLCEFLRFVVEERLNRREDRIQENVIALEVYHRGNSFDPRIDSIVRSEAHRLRTRLKLYYEQEGRQDSLRISLPGRGYVPAFQPGLQQTIWSLKGRRAWKAGALGAVCLTTLLSVMVLMSVSDRVEIAGGTRGIAVLPLKNLSGDPEEEYFAEGVTDSLINNLARIQGLRVISRTSTMNYRDTDKSAPEIAKELRVEHLVEGTVLQSDNRVRISAQLIHGPTDQHVWAASYERELGEILGLQGDVVKAIAAEIQFQLTTQDELRLGFPERVNPEAYKAYLKGRSAWNQWTQEGAARSIEYFQQAVAADPRFAAAYAGLSHGYRQSSTMGDAPRREMLSKSRAAIWTSLKLDPDLAESHYLLAGHYAFEFDWINAEKRFQRAIELAPANSECHHVYAIHCLAPLGRLKEAEAEIRRALDLDPLSLNNKVILGKILYFQHRFGRAATELEEVLEMDANYPDGMRNLAAVYVQTQRYHEAIELYERAEALSRFSWGQGLLAHGLAVAGQTARARKLLEELLERSPHAWVSPLAIATAYVGLGERDKAFEWLEKSIAEHEARVLFLGVDPVYDPLRPDPRFLELLEMLKLR